MRILDNISDKSLKNVILYLTFEEASELRDSLDELLEKPLHNHAHVSSEDYQKEVTVCIYDVNNLQGFDERSKSLIINDEQAFILKNTKEVQGKYNLWKAQLGNRDFEIEEESVDSFRLYAFENDEWVSDSSKDSFENAVNYALAEFGVPKDAWIKVNESESRSFTTNSDALSDFITFEKEEEIRKQWLESLIAATVFFNFPYILAIFITIFLAYKDTGVVFSVSLGIFTLIPSTLWFSITYYCSYKKRGTAWLMWVIIAILAGGVLTVSLTIKLFQENSSILLLGLTTLVVELYFFINCLRLYKVNSKRKQTLKQAYATIAKTRFDTNP